MSDDEDIWKNSEDSDMALVRGAVARLAEHFECVQVFVSKVTSEGTISCTAGGGNFYARYGNIRAWTLKQEAQFKAEEVPE